MKDELWIRESNLIEGVDDPQAEYLLCRTGGILSMVGTHCNGFILDDDRKVTLDGGITVIEEVR